MNWMAGQDPHVPLARHRLAAVALTLLLLPLATPAAALPGADGGPGPSAPGPFPNGTLGNGSIGNGSIGNGSIGNGSIGNGTIGNGSIGNISLPPLGLPVFEDATDEAGFGSVTGSRVAWGDFDNDGFDDIMFSGGRLFHNNRDGTFSDVGVSAGTQGPYTGGVWGDYNNDGWLDFYATAWRENWDTLLRNNGDGTFTNVTVAAGGVYDDLPSEAAAWGDFDNDGCLDLYVANYEWPPLDNTTESFGTPNILWHNNCDGTFQNATNSSGVLQYRRSRGVVWTDYNHDGLLDLYVSNYRLEPNELWENLGNGTFTNVAPARGVDCDNRTGTNPSGVCGHSIGADVADYNNDGNLDLFVANLNHPRLVPSGGDFSALYRNGGAPNYNFNNLRAVSGIGYCETASNPTWGDFDSDGDPDLFVTSIYEGRGNNLYRNDPLLGFTEVTDRAGVASDNGWGAAWSDFDNDGDLDLLVGSSSGARLWRNPGTGNSWIELSLHGLYSNKAAIGARVTVTSGRNAQVQEVQGGEGTASQSSLRLFFGLGSATGSVQVQVEWPSGLVQDAEFAVDGIYRLDEPEGTHDLAVVSVELSPPSPVVNSHVTANASLENVGQIPVDSAVLAFYRGSVSPSNRLTTVDVDRFTGSFNASVQLNTPSSPGQFTVIAAVEQQQPSDDDPSNDQRIDSVTVRAINEAPNATLTASPLTVTVGQPVTFEALGSSDDTGIAQYIFAFGDGASANSSEPTVQHNYSTEGSYIARLTVIDQDGAPSTNDASVAITVNPEGASPPVAFIDSVSPPPPVMVGTAVTFEGRGESQTSTIAEYEWESDIEGVLSHDPIFQTDELSLGNHHITLRVRDAQDVWSDPATVEVLVVNAGNVAITIRDLVNDSVVGPGIKIVRGTAVAPGGVTVVSVEWRLGSSSYGAAQGTDEWSFALDAAQFDEGTQDLTVRATDSNGLISTRTISILVTHSQGPASGGPDLTMALIVGSVVAVVAALVVGVALVRRRGRGKKGHAPPPLGVQPTLPPPPPGFAPRPGPPPGRAAGPGYPAAPPLPPPAGVAAGPRPARRMKARPIEEGAPRRAKRAADSKNAQPAPSDR